MALLTLKDIGKIYVSEGNVAVGIRGVSLSFDRGEFVAVTGKSGSGKSTLLNVISGMDSYEEGELYIDGQSTSHYLQPDWEEYRQKYISFIFQDYNIIESFTVLQNVELALMHIEDKKQRRRRALELIDRVGLSSHIKHKGSKLSGGQKQRTVIARALAKDSPIILADEPTGNLDSATSAEIIELLREVSRDKLLIVVTHNFEQVESCATRHIRIFDGAVESDHVLSRPDVVPADRETVEPKKGAKKRSEDLKNGLTLGRSIFTSKPKLSVFLCLLTIIGTMGIFLVTSLLGEAGELFEPYYMFEPIEGRVVLTKQNGEVMSDGEISALASEYGASEFLHYDALLDTGFSQYVYVESADKHIRFDCTYGEDFGGGIVGSYPKEKGEVLLYLPISWQPHFGEDEVLIDTLSFRGMPLKVTGVKYFYDNNKQAKCLFTSDGFKMATAMYYLLQNGSLNIQLDLTDSRGRHLYTAQYYDISVSYDIEDGKIYVDDREYRNYFDYKEGVDTSGFETNVSFSSTHYNYNYHNYDSSNNYVFTKEFDNSYFTNDMPADIYTDEYSYGVQRLVISAPLLREMAESVLKDTYRQASLFFESDREARAAAEELREKGYIAVPADTTYTPDATETILNVAMCICLLFVWLIAIVFLAFFINLCSSRTLGAFKSDMAIMRSMGIPVRVIRIGMYVRMLIALIPAYITVIAAALVIFLTPRFNEFFVFLYPWQYAMIFVGMLILTARITYKQIRKLFRQSVKRALKGGAAE